MDQEISKPTGQNLHTISSSLAVQRSSQSLTPAQAKAEYIAKAQAISVQLAQLAPMYYRPDFGEAQAKALFANFVEDLADLPVCEVELAIREYRRNPANKFFPTSGQIRPLALAAAKERRELSRPVGARPVSRPLFWWTQSRAMWKPNWKESEIPAEHWDAYERRKARAG